jgi:folate-binding protein YgfZ
MELPLDYGDAAGEYAAVRGGAGLLDRGNHGLLEVTGRDRAKFLHAMLSNDIVSLKPGQGRAASFLDIHGKVQVVLIVWALDDRILLVTPPGLAEKTLADFDKFLFSEKAYFRDATGELAMLVLAGPATPAIAERLTGALPAEAPWSHVTSRLGDLDVRVVRGGGETGGPEIWLVGPADGRAVMWSAALAAGARPVGLTAWESLRVEAGTPLYGHDVDETVLLPEIPCADLVSYTKGCYIGQEVVVRIRDRGHVNRLLTGLRFEGGDVPARGAEVRVGPEGIGRVTSAVWSFGLAAPIALAFVRRQHAEAGTPVTVVAGDHPTPAVVSALPFSR